MAEPAGNLSDTGKLIGRVLDNRYQIVELIGRGGMSAVYRATQLSMGKTVAVKVMARSLSEDDKLLQRFNQEALASSRLRHPNTIKVFDYGQSNDGYLFLAMEYLEGQTLGQVIKYEAPLDARRSCKVARQVCKSLAEAHRAGIVHRDLKPDNVFLTDIYGERDFVKVLDFGIAKFMTEGTQETLTQTGFICGTPLYLSPEQGLGKALDVRTDLYSLGVMLYEMLLGQTPFRGDSPISVVMKHIHEAPPSFHEKNPEVRVPLALEDFVMRMMAKNPCDRPSSAEEAGALLDELIGSGHLPETASKPRRRVDRTAIEAEHEAQPPPLPAAATAGRVVSMHANARPTMYLPLNEVQEANASHDTSDEKTTAVPNPWGSSFDQAAHGDSDWEDRTVVLTPNELRTVTGDDDPDRTEFLPVSSAGRPAPVGVSNEAATMAVDVRAVDLNRAVTAGIAAPEDEEDEEEEEGGRSWLALAAVIVAIGLGVTGYFLKDRFFGSTGDADPVATVAGATETPAPSETPPPEKEGSRQPEAAKTEVTPGGPAPQGPAKPGPLKATPPSAMTVVIKTDPEKAEVFEGQTRLGETPLTLQVSRKEPARSLSIRLAGHKDEVVLVDPWLMEAGAEVDVKLTLASKSSGPAAATPGVAVQEPPETPKGEAPKVEGAPTKEPAAVAKPDDTHAAKPEPKKKTPKKSTAKKGKTKKGNGGASSMEWKDW